MRPERRRIALYRVFMRWHGSCTEKNTGASSERANLHFCQVELMETATTRFEEMPHAITVIESTPPMADEPAWPDAIIAGSLLGDLSAVAKELYRAVQHYPVTAWMNADADVLYQRADGEVPAIVDWIAGTYAAGTNVADIEQDLDQLRVQRRSMGMIEV